MNLNFGIWHGRESLTMLELRDISYRYPGDEYDTADGLSFSVKRGSFNCILGVSGCGKSTVFRLINGLLKPQKGAIFIDGKDASTLKMRCGYMPQKDMLFPWRSVGDNVMLPLEVNKALKNPLYSHKGTFYRVNPGES